MTLNLENSIKAIKGMDDWTSSGPFAARARVDAFGPEAISGTSDEAGVRSSVVPGPGSPESFGRKLAREAKLLGEGLAGLVDAARSSSAGEIAGKAGLSFGIGLGLAYLNRGKGFLPLAAKTTALAATGAFALDVAGRASDVSLAFADTWRSDNNWDRNSRIVRDSLGQFAFDTAVMAGSGVVGARVGHSLFLPSLSRIPTDLTSQMGGNGVRHDYYNKLMPAQYYAEIAANSGGAHGAEKVAKARGQLDSMLKGVMSYSEYTDAKIGGFRARNPAVRFDVTGARNLLLNMSPNARKLDGLTLSLRKLGSRGISERTLPEIRGKFKQAQTLIYED